jgi:hypothetical protein
LSLIISFFLLFAITNSILKFAEWCTEIIHKHKWIWHAFFMQLNANILILHTDLYTYTANNMQHTC